MERTWTSGPTKIAYMCDDSPERRKNLRLELKKETLVCLSQPTNPTISTSRAPLGHIDQSPGSHFHCNSYPVSVPPRNRLKGSDTWKGKDPTFLPIPMSFLCYQALAATLHRFCPFDWPPVGPIAPWGIVKAVCISIWQLQRGHWACRFPYCFDHDRTRGRLLPGVSLIRTVLVGSEISVEQVFFLHLAYS